MIVYVRERERKREGMSGGVRDGENANRSKPIKKTPNQ